MPAAHSRLSPFLSVGAYNRTFSTPGVRENAWFLKGELGLPRFARRLAELLALPPPDADVQNARAIRWRILECFEQADHPKCVRMLRGETVALLLTLNVAGQPD